MFDTHLFYHPFKKFKMIKKCEIFKHLFREFPACQLVIPTHISNPDTKLSMKTIIHPCSNLQTDLEHPLLIMAGVTHLCKKK